MIKVVAGVLCNDKLEILVALRPKHALQGGLWEFPGGKVEASETPEQALGRELREEIGITLLRAKPFAQIEHTYPERAVSLDVWWVEKFQGTPQGVEGQEIKWVNPAQLSSLELPAANKPIVKAIQELLG